MPHGAALGRHAFDLVINSAKVMLDDADIIRLRRSLSGLRLEILLERLATEIPKSYLFAVFDILRSGVPNLNHLAALRLRPRSIITTNQDLLLEKAAERLNAFSPIIHLHGRCDDKESIVTMISQYLAGLARWA